MTKRVIFGKDADGISRVLYNDEAPRVIQWDSGVDNVAVMWDDNLSVPMNFPGGDPTLTVSDMFPPPGGVSFQHLHFVAGNPGPVTGGADVYGKAHDIAGLHMNVVAEEGGWHTTASVDYGTVIQGTVDVLMRNGDKVTLTAGDLFVQRGGDHMWGPHQDEDVIISIVIVGHDA
jgi:uncharacterized cupin superfamily protein